MFWSSALIGWFFYFVGAVSNPRGGYHLALSSPLVLKTWFPPFTIMGKKVQCSHMSLYADNNSLEDSSIKMYYSPTSPITSLHSFCKPMLPVNLVLWWLMIDENEESHFMILKSLKKFKKAWKRWKKQVSFDERKLRKKNKHCVLRLTTQSYRHRSNTLCTPAVSPNLFELADLHHSNSWQIFMILASVTHIREERK